MKCETLFVWMAKTFIIKKRRKMKLNEKIKLANDEQLKKDQRKGRTTSVVKKTPLPKNLPLRGHCMSTHDFDKMEYTTRNFCRISKTPEMAMAPKHVVSCGQSMQQGQIPYQAHKEACNSLKDDDSLLFRKCRRSPDPSDNDPKCTRNKDVPPFGYQNGDGQ
jgi:hypothetical protein